MEVFNPEKSKPKIYLPEVKDVLISDAYFEWAYKKINEIDDNENTLRHTQRVTNLCALVSRYKNFSERMAEDFIEIGFLHDMGKMDVPAEALNKHPNEFSEADRKKIDPHAYYGYQIVRAKRGLRIANPILVHHEFQDRDYPPIGIEAAGMSDEDIDLGRLLAMIDVFDRRVFGSSNIPPMAIGQAEEKLKEQFDQSGDKEIIDFLFSQYETIKNLSQN